MSINTCYMGKHSISKHNKRLLDLFSHVPGSSLSFDILDYSLYMSAPCDRLKPSTESICFLLISSTIRTEVEVSTHFMFTASAMNTLSMIHNA